ncbi:MAG: hypothetical protein RJA09_671, partial [Pseudomonadota bacterium]
MRLIPPIVVNTCAWQRVAVPLMTHTTRAQ